MCLKLNKELYWYCIGTYKTPDYWKTHKSFIKPSQNTAVPPLLHEGIYNSETSDKANLLNAYFVNQTIVDEQSAHIPNMPTENGEFFNSISISQDEVKSVLQSLKSGKSSGYDNIINKILKELALQLSKPLCDLFNFSLTKGICPDTWKKTNVSPVFKKR